MVWLIQPDARSVVVYTSADVLPHTLTEQDELALPEIVPDFRCKVADLFSKL